MIRSHNNSRFAQSALLTTHCSILALRERQLDCRSLTSCGSTCPAIFRSTSFHVPRNVDDDDPSVATDEKKDLEQSRAAVVKQILPPAADDQFGDEDADLSGCRFAFGVEDAIHQRLEDESVGRVQHLEFVCAIAPSSKGILPDRLVVSSRIISLAAAAYFATKRASSFDDDDRDRNKCSKRIDPADMQGRIQDKSQERQSSKIGAGGRLNRVCRQGAVPKMPVPPPTQTQTPEKPCATSAKSLDNYLTSKHSPLAGQGANLMASGQRFNVDPRFVVALAGAETTFGTAITRGANNAWNWLYNGLGKQSPFQSYQSGITSVSRGIGAGPNYLSGNPPLTTSDSVYGKYCSGPDCANGIKNLKNFMQEQHANPNSLGYPCKR